MQALTPSVFPCYAAADREVAAGVAAFLERGADVRVFLDEGEMRPGEDVAGKAREARMADVVLVLFSRNSMPSRWPRSEWEDALCTEPAAELTRIGFLKCDDCIPPRVLAPRFEVSGLALKGLRELKRWVRDGERGFEEPASPEYAGDLEVLGIAIADRPGAETVASAAIAGEFARVFRRDFDQVFRLQCADACGDRSLAALAGDLAAQLGLDLNGDLPDNLLRLRNFCAARRFLLVLEGVALEGPAAPAPELVFGGQCSTLICSGQGAWDDTSSLSTRDPLRAIQQALRDPGPDLAWSDLCRMARLGRRLTRDRGRIAECCELMAQWRAAAEVRGDAAAENEAVREIVWILEGWGRMEEARLEDYVRACEFDEQLPLPFG